MSFVAPVTGRLVDITLDELVRGETPPARLEYLTAINERILALATTPYVVPSLVGDFRVSEAADGGTTSERWLVSVRLAAGARSFRPRLVFAADSGNGTHGGATLAGVSSGGDPEDAITVASPLGSGTPGYSAVAAGRVVVQDGADSWVTAPDAAQDRLAVLTPVLRPSSERFEVDGCVGFGGEVRTVGNLLDM